VITKLKRSHDGAQEDKDMPFVFGNPESKLKRGNASANDIERGHYFPCRFSFIEHVKQCRAGRVVNFYKDLELNVQGVAGMQNTYSMPMAVQVMLMWHGPKIIDGVPIQSIIDLELSRLRKKIHILTTVNKEAFLKRGKGNKGLFDDLQLCVDWLTFNRSSFSSHPISNVVLDRCLRWDSVLVKQPKQVREALPALGVEGSFMVNDQIFFNRGQAMNYLDQLMVQGEQGSMSIGIDATGCDAYNYLKKIHGEMLPKLLCNHGVYGVAYSQGYSCLLV